MFPTHALASALPWPQDDHGWMGVVRWVYLDQAEWADVVPAGGPEGGPARFATPLAALHAAEDYASRFRLSERTERLVGVYGGESGG